MTTELPFGGALLQGGLGAGEVAFRTAVPEKASRRMAEASDLLVGAGTAVAAVMGVLKR